MEFTKDEYIIVKNEKGKPVLLLVKDVGENESEGILEGTRPDTVFHTFEPHQVIANIGDSPAGGSAFGCQIEPYWRTMDLKQLGELHFFRRISKKDWAELKTAIAECRRWLDSAELSSVLPIDLHLRPAKGRVLGTCVPAKGENLPIITLRPKEFVFTELLEVLMHEVGHLVYSMAMPDRLKAQWIGEYKSLISLEKVTTSHINTLFEQFIQSEAKVKAFHRNLEKEDNIIFKACLHYIKETHNLRPNHIDILVAQGDDIEDIWPSNSMDIQSIGDTITDYAKKSPEELWAEAFMLHSTGKKLPKTMAELMRNTLLACRR